MTIEVVEGDFYIELPTVQVIDQFLITAEEPHNFVFVMDHETRNFVPPERDYVYRSGWLKGDERAITPIHIRTMYIGMLDAWDGTFKVTFYRNNSWKPVVTMSDILSVGPDDGSNIVTDIAGSAELATAATHDPRLIWRQVPVGLENAHTWAFQITSSYPARLHLAAFAFDISVATSGQPRGRIPQRGDT